ncbi:FMN-binding negative transcriptional regulator [Rhabdaerophilum sp. SD176]|uniref:FMN-binding negative transcriptional regulator n=1 Tax=Rhabdaerophilum sp. SD176 TaxID=2983548 RepID=UPI0024E02EBE|nr:FMN-binding negative transcriptional regulator [Rhabdaerophilum sp. SD176]
MYQPPHFRIEDRAEMLALIRAHPLGILVSGGEGGLMANPIPFLVQERPDGTASLLAHLARPNPQWRALAEAPEALVVFQGHEHYITPSWYASKREHGKVVPTWNYMMVQVRGKAIIQDDRGFLMDQISALTAQEEGARPQPWEVTDAPEPFIEAQMRGIVGIEIPIREISGKYKLSQNRQAADHDGVVSGLAGEKGPAGPAMAETMRRHSGKPAS